jgi:hypothetical protein
VRDPVLEYVTSRLQSNGEGNEHRFSYQELLRLQVKLQQEEKKKRYAATFHSHIDQPAAG